jgi:hypothetical protein
MGARRASSEVTYPISATRPTFQLLMSLLKSLYENKSLYAAGHNEQKIRKEGVREGERWGRDG